jgi:hypothetical protein
MTIRRPGLLVAAVVALALGLVLALLAVDVFRWRDHLEHADSRFAAAAGDRAMWEAPQVLPFDAARRLVGVDDDIRLRRAIQTFRLSRPTLPPQNQFDAALRAEAAFALARVAGSDSSREGRSVAALLEGALSFELARTEQIGAQVYLERTVDAFRRAVRLDPTNDEAKYNLELVLNLLRDVEDPSRSSGRSRARGGSPEQGAGSGSEGSGF